MDLLCTFLFLLNIFISTVSCNNEYSLIDKTVIVTGGARGIGYAIADNFLAEGAKTIIILDKNATSGPVAAETLNDKYGCGKAVFIHCHVFRDMHVWDEIISNYPNIDVLVNNAGVTDVHDPDDIILTNTAAPIAWSLKFRDQYRKDNNGPGGTIINIISSAVNFNYPLLSIYVASKCGMKGFTQNFGHDYNYQKTGVRVVGICPDVTNTDILKQQAVEDDQIELFNKMLASFVWQEPDAVGKAAVIVYKNATTGAVWTVSGGELFEANGVESSGGPYAYVYLYFYAVCLSTLQ